MYISYVRFNKGIGYMVSSTSPLSRFTKTANLEWTSKGVNRGFTGVIVFVDAPATDRFTLTINPGAVVSTYDTLHKAKDAFRRFLLDKPVI